MTESFKEHATIDELCAIARNIRRDIIEYTTKTNIHSTAVPTKIGSIELDKTILSRDKTLNPKKKVETEITFSINNKDDYDTILRIIKDKYAHFNESFPVIVSWMIKTGKYTDDAFKRYLIKRHKAKSPSAEDFLKMQHSYIVDLYKDEQVHSDPKKVAAFNSMLMKSIDDELKQIKEIEKEVDEDMEKIAKLNREDLITRIKMAYMEKASKQ
jgi:hypothetical protein